MSETATSNPRPFCVAFIACERYDVDPKTNRWILHGVIHHLEGGTVSMGFYSVVRSPPGTYHTYIEIERWRPDSVSALKLPSSDRWVQVPDDGNVISWHFEPALQLPWVGRYCAHLFFGGKKIGVWFFSVNDKGRTHIEQDIQTFPPTPAVDE